MMQVDAGRKVVRADDGIRGGLLPSFYSKGTVHLFIDKAQTHNQGRCGRQARGGRQDGKVRLFSVHRPCIAIAFSKP